MAEAAKAAIVLTGSQAAFRKFNDYLGARETFIQQQITDTKLDAKRVIAAAVAHIAATPALWECDPESVRDAVVAAAKRNLVVGPEGYAWLIPYAKVCQYQLGYKGVMELMRRSGAYSVVTAFAVHKNDPPLDVKIGTDSHFNFTPKVFGDRGPVIGYVAFAKQSNGEFIYNALDVAGVQKIQSLSKSGGSPAWRDHFDRMGLKCALKQLGAHAELSAEDRRELYEDDEKEFAEARDVTPHRAGDTQAARVKASMLPKETATIVEDAPPHDPTTGEVTPEPVSVATPAPTVERKPRAAKTVEVSDPQTEALILDAITSAEGDEDLKDAHNRFQASKSRLSTQQQANINAALELAGWKE